MGAVTFLASFVSESLIRVLFDKTNTKGFGDICFKTLVVVMNGSLTSYDGLPFGRVSLFLFNKEVKFIDVLRGNIIKSLDAL